MGTAAIASAWTNWRATRSAGDELVRAQAQVFRDAVLPTNRIEPAHRAAALDSIVTNHAEGGLHFAGWVRSDGSIVVSGGRPAPQPIAWSDTTPRVQITHLGARVRAVYPPPKSPARFRETFERVAEPPAAIVVEFQPILAESMAARAASTLIIAGVVALVLMGAAIGFWRLAQRIEEQRRLSALGEMSAVLAHEIRNPLASLKGHAQLLAERLTDEQDRRRVERVVNEATRLEALTGDLLDFSRSGPMDLRPVDPVALLRAAAAETGGSIQIESAHAPKSWQLDERRFRQAVLDNILRNAVQAAPAARRPEARVELESGDLIFTIRDFGPGLPAGQEERIFDPFFTTRSTGTGLGLAVARRVVELHGGRLVAMNASDGPGAVFRIELHGDNSRRR